MKETYTMTKKERKDLVLFLHKQKLYRVFVDFQTFAISKDFSNKFISLKRSRMSLIF